MAKFGMVGKFTTEPGDREALLAILTEAAEAMQAVEGCSLYVVSKDAADERGIWVMELWDSKEAHDESLTLPGTRELIGKALPLLAGKPEGTHLIPVSGKGL